MGRPPHDQASGGTGHPRASAPGLQRRPGEHIAFAVGARPIAPPDGAAGDDWRVAVGTDAARAGVADYRPGWCLADASVLLRRAWWAC